MGDGLPAAEVLRRATAARRPKSSCGAAPAATDSPRMLGAFNEETPDWLSFFMFTFFTDRDGKMQLESLAQSGFDPLSRTCRFMLTEEAFHMFVGENGVSRIVERTCEAMRQAGIEDPYDVDRVRALGVIDLPTIQKKMNLHYSLTLDLFGSELSTNAANFFNAGLKGRFKEIDLTGDDHQLTTATYDVLQPRDGGLVMVPEPALNALNARLRDDFSDDCNLGVQRWNKIIQASGVPFEMRLSHVAFHRQIGLFANTRTTPTGELLSEDEWKRRSGEWLPSSDDKAFIESLMKPEWEPGKYAELDRRAQDQDRSQARRLRVGEVGGGVGRELSIGGCEGGPRCPPSSFKDDFRVCIVYILSILKRMTEPGDLDCGTSCGFEWDEANVDKNWIKHRVRWSEAEEVFTHTAMLDQRATRQTL